MAVLSITRKSGNFPEFMGAGALDVWLADSLIR